MIAAFVALIATSCTTLRKTATAVDVNTELNSQNIADLEISSKRVSYDFRPTKSERRGGKANVIRCAYAATLEANGGADVLVQPQYTMRITTNLFGRKKVKEVLVSGYPAKFKTFKNK